MQDNHNNATVRLLIIDDDEIDRYSYIKLLENRVNPRYEFFESSDYQQAADIYNQNDIDCILVDYLFPKMTGIELIEELKNIEPELKAPVIMLTGQGSEKVASQAIEYGLMDYLIKTEISSDGINRSITNACEKWVLSQTIKTQYNKLVATNASLTNKHDELNRLYHNLSHELKTPLTSMKEFISIILEGLAGPINEQQGEYLSIAQKGCSRMSVYINDLLDFNKLESGKLEINPQKTNLSEFIKPIITEFSVLAEKKNIVLHCKVQNSLPVAYIDTTRIYQVIMNLLNNSLKFMEQGKINVTAVKQDEQYILISISDTGRGVSEDDLSKVFERLFQVRCEKDESSMKGLGLGLSLCKGLVELHQSNIYAKSKIGVGSTFSFTVPTFDPNQPQQLRKCS